MMARISAASALCLALAAAATPATAVSGVPRAPGRSQRRGRVVQGPPAGGQPPRPTILNCTWRFITQPLDHFNEGNTPAGNATFSERYCVYEGYMPKGESPKSIMFYTGNEAPVDEYVNNTGLMWTLAESLDSLIVFAEHRYEGESFPDTEGLDSCMSFCTTQQALADYASLVRELKSHYAAPDAAVVAFGGSYGGMLSAWARIKYPNVFAGAIAASAPIWGLPLTHPTPDDYAVAISRGVSAAGGATDTCFDNLAAAFVLLGEFGKTDDGRAQLSKAFNTCSPLKSEEDVAGLLSWAQGCWFTMAEGNYPFPSTYITYNVGPGYFPLPAWPMRKACSLGLDTDLGVTFTGNRSDVRYTVALDGLEVDVDWDVAKSKGSGGPKVAQLAAAVAAAVDVWYNVSGTLKCNDVSSEAAKDAQEPSDVALEQPSTACGKIPHSLTASWGAVCCNEHLSMVCIMARGTGRDFFWPPNQVRGFNVTEIIKRQNSGSCRAGPNDPNGYPATSDPFSTQLDNVYGGLHIEAASNIVFSNGLLDPWSSGGVTRNLSSTLTAVILPLGAHHLDLMWPDPRDPPCAVEARKAEEAAIKSWIADHHAARQRASLRTEL